MTGHKGQNSGPVTARQAKRKTRRGGVGRTAGDRLPDPCVHSRGATEGTVTLSESTAPYWGQRFSH